MRTRQRYKSKARGRRAAVVRHPRKRTHVTRFNARSYIVNKIDIFKFNNLLPWISKFWTPPASTELSKIHRSSWDFGNIWRIICKNVRFGPHWCLLIFWKISTILRSFISSWFKMFVLDPTGVYWFGIIISNIQKVSFFWNFCINGHQNVRSRSHGSVLKNLVSCELLKIL